MQHHVDGHRDAYALAQLRCDEALDRIASGNSAAAVVLFREALELNPADLDSMHGLVRALQDTGRLDEAIIIANRLIAIDPDDVLAHTGLSILYQHKGMVPEAEAEATRARVLDWKRQLQQGVRPNIDL